MARGNLRTGRLLAWVALASPLAAWLFQYAVKQVANRLSSTETSVIPRPPRMLAVTLVIVQIGLIIAAWVLGIAALRRPGGRKIGTGLLAVLAIVLATITIFFVVADVAFWVMGN